jgi:hypothetical protein
MMLVLVSLLVCLSAQPHVCETVLPDYTHADGSAMTFFECPERTRERVQSPEA